MSEIYEWHDKLPYKYVILISACNPLLTIETIDDFINFYLQSDRDGAFGVFEKKTYYWDKNENPITNWGDSTIMNTKFVDHIYEAGHCLYASRLDVIKDGNWMDTSSPPQPELFVMEELETPVTLKFIQKNKCFEGFSVYLYMHYGQIIKHSWFTSKCM